MASSENVESADVAAEDDSAALADLGASQEDLEAAAASVAEQVGASSSNDAGEGVAAGGEDDDADDDAELYRVETGGGDTGCGCGCCHRRREQCWRKQLWRQ